MLVGAAGKAREMKNCETLERMLKMSEGDHEKTGKVISRSFYKILRQNGFTHAEIMSVTGIRSRLKFLLLISASWFSETLIVTARKKSKSQTIDK